MPRAIFMLFGYISIHAPTRGATLSLVTAVGLVSISIHAPTRGATNQSTNLYHLGFYFNPRSHERSDVLLLSAKKQALNFNPRSHERSDSTSSASYSFWINFNPRSHERSDPLSQTILLLYRLFQSTLPREERPYLFAVNALLSNHFNPRSHERSDQELVSTVAEQGKNFNPRSHERSDT